MPGLVDPQLHFTLLRKLERVREQVLEDLVETLQIGFHEFGQLCIGFDEEAEMLGFGDRLECGFHKTGDLCKTDGRDIGRDESGFDLRKIQDIIDELN